MPMPASPLRRSAWGELFRKEDWWAIWIGLGLVAVAVALFANGSSIKWIAVAPQKWSHLADVGAQLQAHGAAIRRAVRAVGGVAWASAPRRSESSCRDFCRHSW